MKPRHYNDIRKVEAREATIIGAYRTLTGLSVVPSDDQYITLCGPMTHDGRLLPYCELNHMMSSGLITANQFHGIEHVLDIHENNVAAMALENGANPPHLYHGEFHEVLSEMLATGNLSPAIVNLDTCYEPERGVSVLGAVLNVLNQTSNQTMLVLNVVLEQKRRGRSYTFEDLTRLINENTFCKNRLLEGGWVESEQGVLYGGTSRSRITMGTNIFYREGPNVRN